VFSIENEEWLQYTVRVEKKGRYHIGFRVAADTDTGRIALSSGIAASGASFSGNAVLIRDLPVPNTGGLSSWQTIEVKNIPLERGLNKLRVYANKGGFNFAAIIFNGK
jgi:endoglucanase